MKRRGLFSLTLLTVVLSVTGMAWAGWFAHPRCARGARPASGRVQARAFDPMNTEAAWRYRHGQASNWRTVAIYR